MYQQIGDLYIFNRHIQVKDKCSYYKKLVTGPYRLLQLHEIYNDISYNPATIVKEDYYLFLVNLNKVYFNSKYYNIRKELAKLINNKEILVVGDGVGPYSQRLCKNNVFVVGLDINLNALSLALFNKRLNKICNYTTYYYYPYYVDTVVIIRPTISFKELRTFTCSNLYFLLLSKTEKINLYWLDVKQVIKIKQYSKYAQILLITAHNIHFNWKLKSVDIYKGIVVS